MLQQLHLLAFSIHCYSLRLLAFASGLRANIGAIASKKGEAQLVASLRTNSIMYSHGSSGTPCKPM